MRILDFTNAPMNLSALPQRSVVIDREVEARVKEILSAVREDGDKAVTTLTRQLDCRFIDSLGLRVNEREIENAYNAVSKKFLKALKIARVNVTRFHQRQMLKSFTVKGKGVWLKQVVHPLQRVGIYIPGGKAAYPSTVLMNALPARIAGVGTIVMTTPCNQEGKISAEVLVAAAECGISELYRIGGAQAIAAFAFGTESIRRVDKITGPGNAYVAAAKQMVYGRVGIDVIAGPTEVVIVADETASPKFIAADLIAQAEHDETATPICITTSPSIVQQVRVELVAQLEKAPRKMIAQRAFDGQGAIILVANLKQAADIVNELSPEHLEVMVKRPGKFAERIRNAGSIFVGEWSTEALGDYVVGTNHTLPTSGTARFSSALSVYDFLRFSNVIEVDKKAFNKLAPHVRVLAEAEGLAGHAESVRVRQEKR